MIVAVRLFITSVLLWQVLVQSCLGGHPDVVPQVVRSHLQVSAENSSPAKCSSCSFSFDIWDAVKGKLSCCNFPPDCLYLGNQDDLFSIFSYGSDCLGLMEGDSIPIRSVCSGNGCWSRVALKASLFITCTAVPADRPNEILKIIHMFQR